MTIPINAESITRNWSLGNRADKYANTRRWRVALPSFRVVGRRNGGTQIIASAIYAANNAEKPLDGEQEAPTDTVERLAKAYRYFVLLLTVDGFRARQARRRFGYTRFAMMYDLWKLYEFDIREKGFDYLEMGYSNSALERFIVDDNETALEWERRSASIYREARKLVDDFGVPTKLHNAAREFVNAYDEVFPPVKKEKR